MTSAEFNQVVEERLHKIKTVLTAKQKEYAREDRMHNFKRGGAIIHCTPEQACVGYMTKHICSVLDMVDDIAHRNIHHTPAVWSEKIGDAMNYFLLLEALILERYDAIPKSSKR